MSLDISEYLILAIGVHVTDHSCKKRFKICQLLELSIFSAVSHNMSLKNVYENTSLCNLFDEYCKILNKDYNHSKRLSTGTGCVKMRKGVLKDCMPMFYPSCAFSYVL